MTAAIRRRLTYANVVATAALVVALAGSGSALALIVTGAQVKDGTLTSADVRNNSLRSVDVRNGAIGMADINPTTRAMLTERQAWEPIQPGVTVTGNFGFDSTASVPGDYRIVVDLPGIASPGLSADTDVNFAPGVYSTQTIDEDAACTGTYLAPTAPSGKVCLYLKQAGGTTADASNAQGAAAVLGSRGFKVIWLDSAGDSDVYVNGTWAYTQPGRSYAGL